MNEQLPLQGVRVIDAGQVIAGPFLAQLLGDFGADVVKVEHPSTGDPYRYFGPEVDGTPLGWKTLSRNKRSVSLNLSKDEGRKLLHRLVQGADVVVSSFRPSTSVRFGLDYDTIREVNHRVIAVLVSGFGQDGAYRDRPGFGTLAEAMSGYAAMTGEQDGPPLLPQFALADSVAALYGAYGVMSALYWRDVGGGGTGQLIDLSLLEPLFSILGPVATIYDKLGEVPKRMGSRIGVNAPRNLYQTSDGHWIAVAASVQQIAARCFKVIGQPELIEDERFATGPARAENIELVDQIVGEWISARTRAEAMDEFLQGGVAVAPVLNVAELLADEHVAERGMITREPDPDLGSVVMSGIVPRLSQTPGRIRWNGPRLGSSNDEVYRGELGISRDELSRLREDGVI